MVLLVKKVMDIPDMLIRVEEEEDSEEEAIPEWSSAA